MDTDDVRRWREQRREAAAAHAAAAERKRAAESVQAQRVVDDFVARARERGLRDDELRARSYDGRANYRTGVRGWYIRRDHSLGVGTDGSFYVLRVPPSLRSRLTGVTVQPSDPPLAVGIGARDGESMSLADQLRLRLEAGDDWP